MTAWLMIWKSEPVIPMMACPEEPGVPLGVGEDHEPDEDVPGLRDARVGQQARHALLREAARFPSVIVARARTARTLATVKIGFCGHHVEGRSCEHARVSLR